MLQAVTHFDVVPGSLLVNLTLDILILLIIMSYFVKDGQYEFVDYVNKNTKL